jgi:multiple sugar transport system permease protein
MALQTHNHAARVAPRPWLSAPRPRLSVHRQEALWGLALLLPAILVLLGLVAYPFFYAVWLSFTDKAVGQEGHFIGLANFAYVISSSSFAIAIWNTVVFTSVAVAIKFGLGMAVALVLNSRIRGRDFFRAFLLLPWVIPAFVAYLVWRWIYDPLQGLLNSSLLDLHLVSQPIAFLSTKETALLAVIIAHAWRGFPFFAVSFLAGLQTIPAELYEAAQVDGANRWQQFRHITLPGLYYVIGVVVLLQVIWTANAFEPIYLLTGGGPSNATMVYTMLAYVLGIVNLRLGEAAAVSILFLPILIGLVLAVTRVMQRRAESMEA